MNLGIAGETGHCFLDPLQQRLLHPLVVRWRKSRPIDGEPLGQPAPFVAVEHDQRGEVGLPLAHHQHLLEQRVAGDGHLDILGRNLLAVGQHDDLLEPADDGDVSGCVDNRLIARVKPSLAIYGGFRRRGVLPVTHHDARPPDQQFLLIGDLHLHPGNGPAHAGRAVVIHRIDGDHRPRLGEAVTLQDGQTERDEELRHRSIEGRPAADGEADAATEGRQNRPGDEYGQQWPEQKPQGP